MGTSLFLLLLAVVMFLTPSYFVYITCMKFDDQTPNFVKVMIKMPLYIKKYRRIQKNTYNRKFTPCFLWYIFAGLSVSLVVVAVLNILN